MEIKTRKGRLAEETADVIVAGVHADGVLGTEADALDQELGGLLEKTAVQEELSGQPGSLLMIRTEGRIPAARIVLVGLGEKGSSEGETLRQAYAAGLSEAKRLKAKRVVAALAEDTPVAPKEAARAIAEGVILADYGFHRFKEDKAVSPEAVEIVCSDGRVARQAEEGVKAGAARAKAQCLARDLVNTPSEHMKPEELVEAAEEALKGSGVRVRVYDRDMLEKLGAGALLGVAQGSDHPPYLVHMTYKPKKKAKKRIALVGKAITFDTGGYSLKPAGAMMGMKADMGGSAAVIGAMSALKDLQPSVEVHGIFGACENMVSGRAIRPGDVLTAMNGKTIEVHNTDAEGRLTLADTLSYAIKTKPDMVLDVATLTGACVVALGEEIAAALSPDEQVLTWLERAAEDSGEKFWELPLEASYRKELESDIADLKNIGGRWGGTITAGLFLQEFVADTPWAHLDIAGPATADKPVNAYTPKGGTGFATRTLLSFLEQF